MNQKRIMTYDEGTHYYGRLWMWFMGLLLLGWPIAVCIRYNAWPPFDALLKGLLSVAPIYWTVGIIESLTFIPMLGAGGTYMGFVTGNLTSLKVPCALNAMEISDIKPGTPEGEVIATFSIAISSIITTVIIIIGVLLIVPLTPILESPVLSPAFDSILPALFGGLSVVFVAKNVKLALAPMLLMLLVCILVPAAANAISLLIPISVLLAIGVARVLYLRGIQK